MPHPLLDPHRLAMLHALGLQQVWVPREALDEAELAALLPRLPGAPQPRGARTAGPGTPDDAPASARREAPARPVQARPVQAPRTPAVQATPAALSESRLQQVRGLDWEALQAFTHDCRACKLGDMRHHAVFGVGHAQAHVMVVGEAPGAEEDRVGEPFVGAAGKLLDNMLRACGLSRAGEDPARSVYIANVIKCRPPGNRNPEPDEIEQCLPVLQRQIELVRPRLLLALGRFAAQALTGSAEPIGRLRQRAWDWQGTPLVVSYHPAYLLRTPQDKAKAWADLCLAQDLLDGRDA
ncbi:uracil-DNA glycosylase family protein [Thiomonas sp.]|uniref:uracil-DNA glycosylase family protein n=1 Tax=Thiomonas sp. TaxID=2047785 RepID=UPI00262FFDFF|nr:uracil-DNA glycosylase family protein [Thiomonas sp.]